MIRSANEIEMMVLKAARGAGVALAQAQDLAGAVGLVAASDPRVLEELATVLSAPMAPPVLDGNDTLRGNPALCLPCALDLLIAGREKIGLELPQPPAAPMALIGAMQAFAWQQHGFALAAEMKDNGVQLTGGGQESAASRGRAEVDDAVWKVLAGFAERLLVPATEASRQSGAGAGLSDND